MNMTRARWIAGALFSALVLASCGDSQGKSAFAPGGTQPGQSGCQLISSGWGPRGQVPLQVSEVARGLEVPWAIGFLPNGDYLLTERPGRVRLVRAGRLVEAPVLTLSVHAEGEGGLMGLAVDPDFAGNRLFYVAYTVTGESGDVINRVARYRLSDDSSQATLDRVILDRIPGGQVHNGGRLRFGPDGALYLGTGDDRQPDLAQDPASPNGKILRLSTEGGLVSPILSGLRNPQAFDWQNGSTLVVADNGPTGELGLTGRDEVSIAHPGENLGWPKITACETASGLVTPMIAWSTALPPGGAVVYRGSAIPEFNGDILIASTGAEHLHRIRPDGTHEMYLDGDRGYGRLREVVTALDGSLLVTTSNCDGRGTCSPEKDKILRVFR